MFWRVVLTSLLCTAFVIGACAVTFSILGVAIDTYGTYVGFALTFAGILAVAYWVSRQPWA